MGGFKAKEALEASLNATPALAAVVAAGLSLAGVETPGAIMAVAEALGNASIPLVMLCLGASWRLSVTARVALAASRALLPRILLGGAVLSAVGVAGALGVLGRADSGIAGAAAAFGVLSVAPMSGDRWAHGAVLDVAACCIPGSCNANQCLTPAVWAWPSDSDSTRKLCERRRPSRRRWGWAQCFSWAYSAVRPHSQQHTQSLSLPCQVTRSFAGHVLFRFWSSFVARILLSVWRAHTT